MSCFNEHRKQTTKFNCSFSSSFQVTVELRLVFLKIGEIDTLKEQFQAEAFIQARWSEPTLKGTVSHM
jgi:hypothetical protein